MESYTLESLREFENEIAKLNQSIQDKKLHPLIPPVQPLFRGQSDATKWKLETTLERYRDKPTSVELYNRYLVRVKPAIESHTGIIWQVDQNPNIDLERDEGVPPNYSFMIYTRHHGFPSPLLDWSQSPYIALYFAFADLTRKDVADVAVYAYVSIPEGGKAVFVGAPQINELGPYATTHPRHYMQKAQYTVCIQKVDEKWTYCSHQSVFDAGRDYQDLLIKYVFKAEIRLEVLRKLDQMNINAYTLFGSEEALMKTIALKEIVLSDV